MRVVRLEPDSSTVAVDALCDAFREYPAMRFILGDSQDYGRRLRTLIGFFVGARTWRREPVLAAGDEGEVAGVALVTCPGDIPLPPELAAIREATWRELGTAARVRYEAFGAAVQPFLPEPPHHHLNMIGVRGSRSGRGYGRALLEAVHTMVEAEPSSTGVSLSTEAEKNVALYRHFGYEVRGRSRVADDLETWVFFRPRSAPRLDPG